MHRLVLTLSALPWMFGCPGAQGSEEDGSTDEGEEDDAGDGDEDTGDVDVAECVERSMAMNLRSYECQGEEPDAETLEQLEQLATFECMNHVVRGSSCIGAWTDFANCMAELPCDQLDVEHCAEFAQGYEDACFWSTGTSSDSYLQVDANGFACGVRSDRTLSCWGRVPEGVPEGAFDKVVVSSTSACAIHDDGTLACWGMGNLPEQTSGTFIDVAMSTFQGCAIRSDGSLMCWRDDAVPTPPSGSFTDVAVGTDFGCALTSSGELVCWNAPFAASGGPFVEVVAGAFEVCARNDAGEVSCWGNLAAPSEAARFRQIDIDQGGGCGITLEDEIACWGESHPSPIPAGTFTQVSLDLEYACAVGTDALVTCWGFEDGTGRVVDPP